MFSTTFVLHKFITHKLHKLHKLHICVTMIPLQDLHVSISYHLLAFHLYSLNIQIHFEVANIPDHTEEQ